MHSLGNNAHAQANHRQWSRDAHKHTRTHSPTFIGHVMLQHARIAHSQWSRYAHKHTRTHTYARTQAHAHASLTVNGHVTRTSTRARTHMQGHKHTRTHTYARTQAHAHASLTVNGHVTRTRTRARIPPSQSHSHVTRTSTHASLTVNGHVTRTHIYARTQANVQEHELSQSSVIRCTQALAHALPRACALNGPEAYFYYYY